MQQHWAYPENASSSWLSTRKIRKLLDPHSVVPCSFDSQSVVPHSGDSQSVVPHRGDSQSVVPHRGDSQCVVLCSGDSQCFVPCSDDSQCVAGTSEQRPETYLFRFPLHKVAKGAGLRTSLESCTHKWSNETSRDLYPCFTRVVFAKPVGIFFLSYVHGMTCYSKNHVLLLVLYQQAWLDHVECWCGVQRTCFRVDHGPPQPASHMFFFLLSLARALSSTPWPQSCTTHLVWARVTLPQQHLQILVTTSPELVFTTKSCSLRIPKYFCPSYFLQVSTSSPLSINGVEKCAHSSLKSLMVKTLLLCRHSQWLRRDGLEWTSYVRLS